MGWQRQAMRNTGCPSVSVLQVNAVQALFTDISLDTLRPCLSRSSLHSGARKRYVCDRFDKDMTRCAWPYHRSHPLQSTAEIPLMPSFWSSDTEGVSSWSLLPQIQWIMAQSLRCNSSRSELFSPHIFLSWSILEWTQAMHLRREVPGGEDRQ